MTAVQWLVWSSVFWPSRPQHRTRVLAIVQNSHHKQWSMIRDMHRVSIKTETVEAVVVFGGSVVSFLFDVSLRRMSLTLNWTQTDVQLPSLSPVNLTFDLVAKFHWQRFWHTAIMFTYFVQLLSAFLQTLPRVCPRSHWGIDLLLIFPTVAVGLQPSLSERPTPSLIRITQSNL